MTQMQNNFGVKTLIKTVTKTLKVKTLRTYTKNTLLKLHLEKQFRQNSFVPLLRTSNENAKNNERHKGSLEFSLSIIIMITTKIFPNFLA